MAYQATLRYARIAPRKLRLVIDSVRGKKVIHALQLLTLSPRRGAPFLIKLIKSAMANALVNSNVDEESLYIKRAVVEVGPVLKRWRAAPMGRAAPIKKRTSHARVILEERK